MQLLLRTRCITHDTSAKALAMHRQKQRKQILNQTPMTHPLHTLKTRQQLRDYLAYTNDAYTRFIDEKLRKLRRPIHPLLLTEFKPEPRGKLSRLKSLRCRWQETTFTAGYELHHIIPRYAGGCDASWNLIHLTCFDHQLAHRLLYDFCLCGASRDPTAKAKEPTVRLKTVAH